MNKINWTRYIGVLDVVFLLFAAAGCAHTKPSSSQAAGPGTGGSTLATCTEYYPVKVDILPLTEFSVNKETHQSQINLYVSLLDPFGSQIKSPCVFRFELYLRVERSSEPKGKRMMIWPDVDMVDAKINNEYWRNFLRAYEFDLPFEQLPEQSYILEVTCMAPNNKRISAEFEIKSPQ